MFNKDMSRISLLITVLCGGVIVYVVFWRWPFLSLIDDEGLETPSMVFDGERRRLHEEDLISSKKNDKAEETKKKRQSLFCFTMTATANHDTRVPAQNDTWTKRCDDHYFFSDSPMKPGFKNLVVQNYSGRDSMWKKFRVSLPYVYTNVSSAYDWYLRADDDTYVIVENLRHFLSKYDPTQLHFFGFHMKPHLATGFMSGPAMIFSNPVMKLLTEKVIPDLNICPIELPSMPDYRFDDLAVSRCLAAVNVTPGYTRDHLGRERFHPYDPAEMYKGEANGGLVAWSKHPVKTGFDAFSEEMISSHHLSPMDMRLFEILLYRVKVHGE